jgi:hypothetical protein
MAPKKAQKIPVGSTSRKDEILGNTREPMKGMAPDSRK